jgi:hypothetical protein
MRICTKLRRLSIVSSLAGSTNNTRSDAPRPQRAEGRCSITCYRLNPWSHRFAGVLQLCSGGRPHHRRRGFAHDCDNSDRSTSFLHSGPTFKSHALTFAAYMSTQAGTEPSTTSAVRRAGKMSTNSSQSLNHLLNFSLPPRQTQPVPRRSRKYGTQHGIWNKESE